MNTIVQRCAVPGRINQPAISHDRWIEIASQVVGDALQERAVQLAGIKAGCRTGAPLVGLVGQRADKGDLLPRFLLGDRVKAGRVDGRAAVARSPGHLAS